MREVPLLNNSIEPRGVHKAERPCPAPAIHYPILLDEFDNYSADFSNLVITISTNPIGDVYLTYQFKIKSQSGEVLVPIAGFKSDYLPLTAAIPIPISVKPKEVAVEIIQLRINNKVVGPDVIQVFLLKDGNKGIHWQLPSNRVTYRITVSCRLPSFVRVAPLSTELVIGIFPPWGWSQGDAEITFKGALLNSTWGYKMIAGVHNLTTGKRLPKFIAGKRLPRLVTGKLRPLLSTKWPIREGIRVGIIILGFAVFFLSRLKLVVPGGLLLLIGAYSNTIIPAFFGRRILHWKLVVKLDTNQEVRLRVRAARFKGIALFSPLVPFWVVAGLLLIPVTGPLIRLWESVIKLLKPLIRALFGNP